MKMLFWPQQVQQHGNPKAGLAVTSTLPVRVMWNSDGLRKHSLKCSQATSGSTLSKSWMVMGRKKKQSP